MPGQASVDERVLRPEQVEHVAILAHYTLKKQLRFLAQGLPQIVIEVREQAHVRSRRGKIPQIQPLLGKVAHQGSRPVIRQHAPDLLFEHLGLFEFSSNGRLEKLVVRNTAPEEEGQARCQLQVGDAIGSIRSNAGRILFDAKQEFRTDQHRAQTHFNTRLKAPVPPPVPVELERRL